MFVRFIVISVTLENPAESTVYVNFQMIRMFFCAVLGRFPDFPYLSVDFCVLI